MPPSRDAWTLSMADYPGTASTRDQLRFMLRYAILAPSTHNTQPWRFALNDDTIDLFTDSSRRLKVIDPAGRQLVMSCGAALFNLKTALAAFGHRWELELQPDAEFIPHWLARVRIIGHRPRAADAKATLDAILTRRTNRSAFFSRPVSGPVSDALAAAVAAQGAWLVRLPPRVKHSIAEVITAADRAQFGSDAFRKELTSWLAPWGSRRRDGIPFPRKEYGTRMPLGLTMIMRSFELGDRVAAKESALAIGSPVLVVLGTDDDSILDWLHAGQALQAMLLAAVHHHLAVSYLNQPLEIPALREQIAALVERRAPQLILRLGFGPPVERPTPRRSLEDVLDERR